jgi:tetratricopeptide (TPR) repeat protein
MTLRIPPPTGAVLRLARWLRGVPAGDLAAKEGFASPSAITMLETDPRRAVPRERLAEILSHMDVAPEFGDAALYAISLLDPPAPPPSLVGLTDEERRAFERAAATSGQAVAETVRREGPRILRGKRAEADRHEAAAFFEIARQLNPKERSLLVETAAARLTWAHAERLALESERAAPNDADRAMELAGLAVRVAEKAPMPEPCRPFLLGWCWAFLGNAHRVRGYLPEAEEGFRQADKFWQQGQGDHWPLDASRLLDLKASLRKHQGRFEEALSLLAKAVNAMSQAPGLGRLLVKEATVLALVGRYVQALDCLERAEALADEVNDPRSLFGIRFNVVVNLTHLERYADADALLEDVRRHAVALGNGLDLIRVLWLQARVWAGIGQRDKAVVAFLQVQEDFTARSIPFDAALVSLELAVVWLEEGRTREVKELALRMLWIFSSQEVQEEALAALRLFHEAALKETATAALTRRVLRFLERAREAPEMRFET